MWSQLAIQQREILAPLAKDWDKMENVQKLKWLGIADRYPKLQISEQQRMTDRMREWASLTPDQRAKIRNSYKDFKQLPAEQKQTVRQKWDAFSSLPPEQRQHFRETGKSSKLLNATPPVENTGTTAVSNTSNDTTPTSPPPIKH